VETLCEEQQNAGYSVNGSFGQFMLMDARYAVRIPAGADPVEVAPILCAGVTVYKGLKMTEARPGQWVVISGIGGLGHIAVQYAVAMGLRVAAVDIADDGVLLTAVHPSAFGQSIHMARRGATIVFNGELSLAVVITEPSPSQDRLHHNLTVHLSAAGIGSDMSESGSTERYGLSECARAGGRVVVSLGRRGCAG